MKCSCGRWTEVTHRRTSKGKLNATKCSRRSSQRHDHTYDTVASFFFYSTSLAHSQQRSAAHCHTMPNWIRGVNLGGWLVLERFITPYLFALTTCHLAGNPCHYPGQIGAPSFVQSAQFCHEMKECKPVLLKSPISGNEDYPVDEYTLMQQFQDDPLAGKQYLEHHYEHFMTRQDIVDLARAGVTHVRVPLPHWILSPPTEKEPYIPDNAWLYFLRLVGWCRDFDIQVWPDLHTAPGSQNGYDNSGHYLESGPTCHNWDESPNNMNRTLQALQSIARAIHNDGIKDVVTGIGILNEPYMDCDMQVVRDFNRKALRLLRDTLGNTTAIVIGDLFNATRWNDGFWEDTPNTYLDSHYYHGTSTHETELYIYIYGLDSSHCFSLACQCYSLCGKHACIVTQATHCTDMSQECSRRTRLLLSGPVQSHACQGNFTIDWRMECCI